MLSRIRVCVGKSFRILDPAIGDGGLLVALINQLYKTGYRSIEAHGFDTSSEAIAAAQCRLKKEFPGVGLHLQQGDFLEHVTKHFDDTDRAQKDLFVLDRPNSELFDIVIANPPYVRTQVMGARVAQNLSQRFGLSGRVDLYYAFIRAIAITMCPGGVLGIIVSNRFMTTRSGASIRSEIRKRFDICHIWDLGDTKVFEAAVLPAVLVLRKKHIGDIHAESQFTSVYSCNGEREAKYCANVFDALRQDGVVSTTGGRCFRVTQGILADSVRQDDIWRVSTAAVDEWLEKVRSKTWATFSEVGKLRVGVKTTADHVFIRNDWDQLAEQNRPELLRPLITHHNAQRYRANALSAPKHILYPHEVRYGKRQAVNLSQYPRAKHYLESHRAVLERRKYVNEAGRNWFEIWVPHDPNTWYRTKLVWWDISETPIFWMDESDAVVNGDCYWMVSRSKIEERLLWLALAVGNSSFIEKFYDHSFNNKLYAGRRRFITQYVEKFPLPDPDTAMAQGIIELAKFIYANKLHADTSKEEREINNLVWSSFGLTGEKS